MGQVLTIIFAIVLTFLSSMKAQDFGSKKASGLDEPHSLIERLRSGDH